MKSQNNSQCRRSKKLKTLKVKKIEIKSNNLKKKSFKFVFTILGFLISNYLKNLILHICLFLSDRFRLNLHKFVLNPIRKELKCNLKAENKLYNLKIFRTRIRYNLAGLVINKESKNVLKMIEFTPGKKHYYMLLLNIKFLVKVK